MNSTYLRPMSAGTKPRYSWPSQAAEVPVRCPEPHCEGQLWREVPTADQRITDVTCSLCARTVAELIQDDYEPMTAAQFAALPKAQGQRRGRPEVRLEQSVRFRPCPECGLGNVATWRQRCQDCAQMRQWDRSLCRRVVDWLSDEGPLHRDILAARLGVSLEALRKIVGRTRAHGYEITTTGNGGLYTLVEERRG